ncbi:MAG: hypothetical protein FWF59_13280 [Turicibacter sp.]|nr:hypothetical protein [Turicibacter sp.]
MNLSKTEVNQFYKIWLTLLWRVNEKHQIIEGFAKPELVDGEYTNPETGTAIRNALWKNPTWIEDIVKEDNEWFDEEEKAILLSWRKHYKPNNYLVMEYRDEHTIFVSGEPNRQLALYGVVGLADPLKTLLNNKIAVIKTVLLPFKDKIVFDSHLELNLEASKAPGLGNLKNQYPALKRNVRTKTQF